MILFKLAQAAHWFDWKKLWPELARILRKNGSVAIWVRFLTVFKFADLLTFEHPPPLPPFDYTYALLGILRNAPNALPLPHSANQRIHARTRPKDESRSVLATARPEHS